MIVEHKEAQILNYMLGKDPVYQMRLANELEITFSHVCKILTKYEKLGIVKKSKDGRRIYVRLTEKGENLAKLTNLINKF